MKIDPCKIYHLKGAVQHYAWGGFEYIPQLLGIDNTPKQPFAEYWLGAHSSAPSMLLNDEIQIGLDKIFSTQPELLGEQVENKFHQLPYLLKILDVKEMLSIQVHPTKGEAEKGFDAEEGKGVDIKAANRNYKDRNHKPEVMIALSDFWLLHGFRPAEDIKKTLSEAVTFRSLIPVFESEGYKGLFQHVMQLSQEEVDAILLPLVQKELKRRSFHESDKNEPGYWVGEYYLNKVIKNIDRGVFSIYFLNLVYLQQGEGIFQAAGIPHAYLQGQNVELMANSDNVLRGGLTNKHIDVGELIKHTRFEAIVPKIIRKNVVTSGDSIKFPVDDFIISRIELAGEQVKFITTSPEILICIEGAARISSTNELQINKGEAFIAFAGNEYTIANNDKAVFFKASVP
jgi:mannose-6-phosphate isomerase